VRVKFEKYGKLINFMDGLTRQASKKPARCKAPERYGQAEKTHTDSVLQTENKIVNLQERK